MTAKPAQLGPKQLATSYHSGCRQFEASSDNIIGISTSRVVLALEHGDELDAAHLREVLRPAYFCGRTPLLTQLQQFQNDRQRLGLVVDEYGELQGLVTIEDIVRRSSATITTPLGTAEIQRARPTEHRRGRRVICVRNAQTGSWERVPRCEVECEDT